MVREQNLYNLKPFKLLVLCSRIWSFLVNVPCRLEKNVNSVVLGGVFYKCQSGQAGWEYCLSHYILTDFLTTLFYRLLRGTKIFSYICGFVLLFPWSYISFCFIYFENLLDAQTLRIIMSYCLTDPFIIMKYGFWSVVIFLALKVALSESI